MASVKTKPKHRNAQRHSKQFWVAVQQLALEVPDTGKSELIQRWHAGRPQPKVQDGGPQSASDRMESYYVGVNL